MYRECNNLCASCIHLKRTCITYYSLSRKQSCSHGCWCVICQHIIYACDFTCICNIVHRNYCITVSQQEPSPNQYYTSQSANAISYSRLLLSTVVPHTFLKQYPQLHVWYGSTIA